MNSFWQSRHTSYFSESLFREEKIHDILIIGQGLTGASIAYFLSKLEISKKLSIGIIDSGNIGEGASGRNAGFLTKGSIFYFDHLCKTFGEKKALEVFKKSDQSLKALEKEIILGNENFLEYKKSGSYSLITKKDSLEDFWRAFDGMKNNSFPLSKLSNEHELRKKCPSFLEGAYLPEEASVNPLKLLHLIFQKANENCKLSFYSKNSIDDIYKDNNFLIATSKRKKFKASKIIMATNAYASTINLSENLGVCRNDLSEIMPIRGQVLCLKDFDLKVVENYYIKEGKIYFRVHLGQFLIIGGLRELEKNSEVGCELKITQKIQEGLFNFAKIHFGENCKIEGSWAGIMALTKSELPIIKKISNNAELYFAGGHNVHGVANSFYMGRELAEVVFARK